MQQASAKPFKTAHELQTELDWAAQALTGDRSPSRIQFALPTIRSDDTYNWDVEVSCRPEQDENAQVAVQYVADKWCLAIPAPGTFQESTTAYRAGATDARRD